MQYPYTTVTFTGILIPIRNERERRTHLWMLAMETVTFVGGIGGLLFWIAMGW